MDENYLKNRYKEEIKEASSQYFEKWGSKIFDDIILSGICYGLKDKVSWFEITEVASDLLPLVTKKIEELAQVGIDVDQFMNLGYYKIVLKNIITNETISILNIPDQAFEITRTITPSWFLRIFKKEEEIEETKLERSLYRIDLVPRKTSNREFYSFSGKFMPDSDWAIPVAITKKINLSLKKYSVAFSPLTKNVEIKYRQFKQGRYKIEDRIYYYQYFSSDFHLDNVVPYLYDQIKDIFDIEKEDFKKALVNQW